MRKGTMLVGVLFVLAMVFCVSAYAGHTYAGQTYAGHGDVTAWEGFWNSVGGFIYNAMPWNWGHWSNG